VPWVRFPVRAFPVARKLITTDEWRLNHSCLFRRGDYKNKDQNSEKLSWVRFPVKMVSVARILSTIEERRQDQSCLSRRRDYRNKRHNTGICPGFESWRGSFMWLQNQAQGKNGAKAKFVRFGKEITGTKVTNPKTVLGSSLSEDFGFRDNFFFNIQRYVTLGMTYNMTQTNPRREPRRYALRRDTRCHRLRRWA
jgi:hypothetical protein